MSDISQFCPNCESMAAEIERLRAVLLAIREPDEGMIEAGWNAYNSYPEEMITIVWQAMIDEALRKK